MSNTTVTPGEVEFIRELRQHREFTDQPVSEEILHSLLEVARWSGSSNNSQPWEFVVVQDRALLDSIAGYGPYSGFLSNAPLVIVLVLDGDSPRSEAYDEGRVSERLMLAAKAFGLGSGTGWWGTEESAAKTREALGIPAHKAVISGVAIGYPSETSRPAASVNSGRKPLADLVHYDTYGKRSV